MKLMKKLSIFVILSLVLCLSAATVTFAVEETTGSLETEAAEVESGEADKKLDMDLLPESLAERAQLALQGTVTGMLMVFSVLGLLAIIMTLSKVVFYDIPNKRKNGNNKKKAKAQVNVTETAPPVESAGAEVISPEENTNDQEIAAVITAAIAAMLESGDGKNEFVGGFRVVSFKRSANSAWNKK